jgi:hypothetical protein
VKTLIALAGCILLFADDVAANREISGEVTYRTSTSVYTSLGRDAGVQDSSMLYVVSQRDTVAHLRVIAVSSASSVCRVVKSSGTIGVGDVVVGTGLFDDTPAVPRQGAATLGPSQPPGVPRPQDNGPGLFTATGRVSAQFYSMQNEESGSSISQPGIVFNTKITSRDLPLALDLYANLRNLYSGDEGVFSGTAKNHSRIYRLSVSYDDGNHRVILGRFAPTFAPSIGYIDGTLLSTSVRRFSFGIAAGFQPSYTQRGMSTDYKKIVLFTSYAADPGALNQVTVAYARTYFRSDLDREAASLNGRMSLSSSFYLSANADFNLREKSGSDFIFSPEIGQVYVNANYRIIQALGIGVGANATRPFYSYSILRNIPDELIDTELRGGASFSVQLYLPAGISLTNTYTPRTSSTGFADNYTEYASLTAANIGYSGVTVRTNFSMGETEYTTNHGYGASLFRNWWNLFDTTLRYQQSRYTLKRFESSGQTTTMAADLMIPFGRRFAIIGTLEHLESSGLTTNTIFAEFTVRF